jgi:ATP sulfurylase
MRAYWALIHEHYPHGRAVLSGLRTYSRYAGPREAVFTATIRQNFGCSHFIIGRDHTGVGDFYDRDASQRIFDEVTGLGIEPVFFDEVYYCRRCGAYVEQCAHGDRYAERISGTQARDAVRNGDMLPDWFMRESVSRLILDELEGGRPVFIG